MSTSKVFTVGQVLTAALCNDWPQGVLSKAIGTADVGPTVGTTPLDVIIANPVTIAGANRRLRISFHARGFTATTTDNVFQLQIKEGATNLQGSHGTPTVAALMHSMGCDFDAYVDNPSVGSHTYKVTIARASGTGTATVSALATEPITITVEDVGQV